MIQEISNIFYFILFCLFLPGVIVLMLPQIKPQVILAPLRMALICIFFIHFLAYALAGMMNIGFGWQRNFFYLLPIYFLVLFYFLKRIFNSKTIYYISSVAILIFSLVLSIQKTFSWTEDNLLREIVRIAAESKSICFVVSERPIDRWPFEYYAKKFKAQEKTVFVPKNISEAEFYRGAKQFLRNINEFVLMQPSPNNFLAKKNETTLRMLSFEMVERRNYEIEPGPYLFLKKVIGYPPKHITAYFYRKK